MLIKSGNIMLQEEEILPWKVQGFPVLYNKGVKDF